METSIKGLTKVVGWLCMLLFTVLVMTTTWQVFSRLVLDSPVTWSEELAKIVFVWLSFLGSAFVYGERGHMAVEFLARKFSPAGEKAVAIFTHAISLVFAVMVLVWGGINAAMNAWTQNLTALPVNMGSVYLVIPVAGVVMAIYAIYHMIEIAAERETTFPVPEAEAAAAEGAEMAAEAETMLIDSEGAVK